MPKFLVTFKETVYKTVTVTAKDVYFAQAKAEKRIEDGDEDEYCVFDEKTEIELIKPKKRKKK